MLSVSVKGDNGAKNASAIQPEAARSNGADWLRHAAGEVCVSKQSAGAIR